MCVAILVLLLLLVLVPLLFLPGTREDSLVSLRREVENSDETHYRPCHLGGLSAGVPPICLDRPGLPSNRREDVSEGSYAAGHVGLNNARTKMVCAEEGRESFQSEGAEEAGTDGRTDGNSRWCDHIGREVPQVNLE